MLLPQGLFLDSNGSTLSPDSQDSVHHIVPKLPPPPECLTSNINAVGLLTTLIYMAFSCTHLPKCKLFQSRVFIYFISYVSKAPRTMPTMCECPVPGPGGTATTCNVGVHRAEGRPVHWRAQGYQEVTVGKGAAPAAHRLNTFLLISVTIRSRRQHWTLPSCNLFFDSQQDGVRTREFQGFCPRYRRT